MALPADVQDQLAHQVERLRLVPADERPPAEEERQRVQRWQDHVHATAETIRWADALIEQIVAAAASPERDHLLADVQAVRAQAFALMQRLNPDQAWFWTQEWQAGEREADADLTAGRTTVHASTEEFVCALRAHLDDADA